MVFRQGLHGWLVMRCSDRWFVFLGSALLCSISGLIGGCDASSRSTSIRASWNLGPSATSSYDVAYRPGRKKARIHSIEALD